MNDVSRHLKRLLWGRFFWGIVDQVGFRRSSYGYRNGTLRRHHHRGGQYRVGAGQPIERERGPVGFTNRSRARLPNR